MGQRSYRARHPGSKATARSPSALDDAGKVTPVPLPHRRVPRFEDASSRAVPTGRRRSSSSGSAASARSATTWPAAKAMDVIVGAGPGKLTATGREDAPTDALRPDAPIPRPALLPPRLAGLPPGHGRRPGRAERHRHHRPRQGAGDESRPPAQVRQEIILATAARRSTAPAPSPAASTRTSARKSGTASSRAPTRSRPTG